MNSQPYLQAHCQSPASQHSSQSFVKELAKPSRRKIVLKILPILQKNKKRHAQSRTERQYYKWAMMRKLNKDNSLQTRRTKNTSCQHCIKAIAGEVVKSRSVLLINFCGGGQVITLKSATALILDR
jgi:formamidopyrimidine-DNA glycosylase